MSTQKKKRADRGVERLIGGTTKKVCAQQKRKERERKGKGRKGNERKKRKERVSKSEGGKEDEKQVQANEVGRVKGKERKGLGSSSTRVMVTGDMVSIVSGSTKCS